MGRKVRVSLYNVRELWHSCQRNTGKPLPSFQGLYVLPHLIIQSILHSNFILRLQKEELRHRALK